MKILVIAAHPDDIDFGVAGSVAKWRNEGAEITYCVVTDGCAGTNEPNADLKALTALRKREQIAAASVVGVKDVIFLGYQDGAVEATLALRRDLTRVIRQVKPDRVVSADPTTILVADRYINHPDHRAVAEAAIYAVFPSAETRPIFPELLYEGLEPHKVSELYLTLTLEPTHFEDITDTIETKLEALAQHRSQVNEIDLERTRGRSADTGRLSGVAYAEAFRVMHFSR